MAQGRVPSIWKPVSLRLKGEDYATWSEILDGRTGQCGDLRVPGSSSAGRSPTIGSAFNRQPTQRPPGRWRAPYDGGFRRVALAQPAAQSHRRTEREAAT